MNTGTARLAAACVAVTAWTGLAVQVAVSYQLLGSVLATLWVVLAYFTIWTNLLVALIFTGIAAGFRTFRASWIIAGAMLSITLVGVIYALLLHGLTELSGGSAAANILLHMVTPALVPIFWIVSAPKGGLTPRDPFKWAAYPLAYLVYALMRGSVTGRYAYPFLDVLALGLQQILANSAAIAAVFLLAGFTIVWLDNRLGRRSAAQNR